MDSVNQATARLPDKARVWWTPAATVAILTPGFNGTKQGKVDVVSIEEDELSAAAVEILLLFVHSSPLTLRSTDKVATPPLDLEP